MDGMIENELNEEKQPEFGLQQILKRIYEIRGQRVMLDSDLAAMYGVGTKSLKRAVKRNLRRFPNDFMFEITPLEERNLRYQNGTSRWGGSRYNAFAKDRFYPNR